MNSLLVCFVIAAVFGVVLSLPFNTRNLDPLIPTVRNHGATKFVHYIHETGLNVNFTKKAGNFTLFVPTNKAFKDLPHKIARNKTALKELLLFHSLNGTYFRKDLKNGTSIKSLLGRNLTFNVTKEKAVLVNGVNITKYNIRATNGVIFLVDKLILNGSGLVNKTKTPTEGQQTLLRRQLLHGNHSHHGNQTHRGTVQHILAQGYSHYSMLVTDLLKTGVWGQLEHAHVTLLAPTNAAMQHINPSYRHHLETNTQLMKKTMKHHVIRGSYGPNVIHQNDMLHTLDGSQVRVTVANGHVTAFDNVAVASVIRASNGYIYVLKNVLRLSTGTPII